MEDQRQYLLNTYSVLTSRLCTWHKLLHSIPTNTLKLELRPKVCETPQCSTAVAGSQVELEFESRSVFPWCSNTLYHIIFCECLWDKCLLLSFLVFSKRICLCHWLWWCHLPSLRPARRPRVVNVFSWQHYLWDHLCSLLKKWAPPVSWLRWL